MMKTNKKIYAVILAVILVLSISFVVLAEVNTNDETKADKPFFKRVLTKGFWKNGLGFLEKGVDNGIIDEDTAHAIEGYFKDKADNRVPLLQELVDQGLITSEQKTNIESYLQSKKDARLDPLSELVAAGLITAEEKEQLLGMKSDMMGRIKDFAVLRIEGYLIEQEILTKDEVKAIHDYVAENKETIASSDKDLLTILLDNKLLTQDQYDKILSLKDEKLTGRFPPNRGPFIRHKMGKIFN